MKIKQWTPLLILLALMFAALSITRLPSAIQAASDVPIPEPDKVLLATISEITGMEASSTAHGQDCQFSAEFQVYLCVPADPTVVPERDPAAATQAAKILYGGVGLLLIPDWTNDRVMAFDPTTGNLVDADFIPSDPTNLSSPKNAILSANGNSILVADQLEDVVQEYDLNGNYLGVFAPAGGPNTAILDNILGIALRPNGNLLVTVTGGSNQDSVAEFDTAGNYLGNFIAIGSGGIDGPFDIYQRSADWLVSSINSNDVNRFDLTTGAFVSELAPISDFPQQLAEAGNDNVLIGNFSGTQEGVVELTPDGTVVDIYNPPAVGGNRGVYELPNGNILTTNGSGVYEIDRSGNLVDTKISGMSAQYIELIQLGPEIHLEKTVGTDPGVCATTDEVTVPEGTAVTYCYEVTNTGTITLTRHDLADSELGTILNNFPFTLIPGASAFLTQTVTIMTDTVNSATWTAYNPGPIDVVTATDVATVTIAIPAIELAKTVGTDPAVCATNNSITILPGTAVTYCYEVTNTGVVTLTRHDLADSELGPILTNFPFTLLPGASAFLTQTVTIVTDTVNMATWTAYNPGPTSVVSATDVATVTIALPDIELVKTVGTELTGCATDSSIIVPVGTAVTYCYEVTNTGNVSLTLHTVVDSELGTLVDNLVYDLLPGASVFITATTTITQNTVNTATWTAQTNSGFEATASATASVLLPEEGDFTIYLPVIIKETTGTAVLRED